MEELFVTEIPRTLNKEQQNRLLELYSTGKDINIREKLIKHNILLILNIINRKFNGFGYEDKKDLFSIGLLALMNAVNNYDIKSGNEFSTYAYFAIKNSILSYIQNNPQHLSLNEEITTEDTTITYLDTISENCVNLEEDYEEKELKNIIYNFISTWSKRDRQLICLYFGFNKEDKRYTQEEIGNILSISHSMVSKILRSKLKLLRKHLIINGYNVEYKQTVTRRNPRRKKI